LIIKDSRAIDGDRRSNTLALDLSMTRSSLTLDKNITRLDDALQGNDDNLCLAQVDRCEDENASFSTKATTSDDSEKSDVVNNLPVVLLTLDEYAVANHGTSTFAEESKQQKRYFPIMMRITPVV
jgi:hypothetical protein